MQGYFFPYIGYFQLINAVDIYVNLDHVSFMKRSYMTRNTIKNGVGINIPVYGGSQNKSCTQVKVNNGNNYQINFLKTIDHLYHKHSPYYEEVLNQLILPFPPINSSISQFNLAYIKRICNYLDIKTTIIDSSVGMTNKKKGEGLKEIVCNLNGDSYINAIGGKELYFKDDFRLDGIRLSFIKMGEVQFENPYTSILDLLFTYPKEYIKEQLNKYELI